MTPLPCPPELWPEFSRLLDQALDRPEAERGAWLQALPAEHAALRPHLARVLHEQTVPRDARFLQAPRLAPDHAAPAPRQPGDRVGPYALVRELGRGGMGEVWLARRDDGAYEREVALKLPHAQLLAGALRERFDRERDILAGLAHAHIARFYDAGLAADGQPYLVIEAVEGQMITEWCQSRQLPLPQRLALFDQVLQAVTHAHAKLVAHRDLKPANVLVTPRGEVKLLDFGIAKLLHESGPAESDSLTRTQGAPATPRYAAPEQLSGAPVSAATDVYALGLMLFELLTDQTALAAPVAGAAVELPLASQQATTPALRRALQGDLDAIVHRATQHAPDARYASVAAMAADLHRHRDHLPISARHITAWHRAAKFVRRHRATVALSGALGVALLAGVAGVSWQAQEARAQARRAEAVKDFLLSVFSAADPRLAADKPNGQTTAKALLDRASARIDAQFANDPDLRIELLRTAADIYRELDEPQAYRALQSRQLALVVARHGPLHDNVLTDLLESANLLLDRGDHAACRQRLDELDKALRLTGQDHTELRAHWWLTRSLCHRDRAQDAALRNEALQQALRLFERSAPGQRGHITAWVEWASEHLSQDRIAPAIAAGKTAAAMAERLPGRNEAELQTIYSNLGVAHTQSGDLMAAGQAFGQAVAVAERTTGVNARLSWTPRSRQARALHLGGDRVTAWALFDPLLAALPPVIESTPDIHTIREDAGERLAAEGRPAQAVALLQQAEQGLMRASNFEFALRRVRRHLGDALDKAGQPQQARQALTQSLQDYLAHGDPHSQPTLAIRERWARFLLEHGEPAKARVEFQNALNLAGDPHWSHVALAQAGLARAALALHDQPAALNHSAQALTTWQGVNGFRDQRMQAYLWRVRAAALAQTGQRAEAQALRQQALAQARRTDAPHSPTLTQEDYLGM
jgi:serine/threonine-protein kinase